jgi:hypothetical protein
MLNTELVRYELEIQHYEHLYEQGLVTFQSEIYTAESLYQIDHLNELMYFVKIYVYHHAQLLLRQIRYKESCFHVKLLRHHRRHQTRSSNKTINVYPQIIIDIPKAKLNQSQLDYLSRTGQLYSLQISSSIVDLCVIYFANAVLTSLRPNYIRLNQSYLYSYERQRKDMQREYESIMDTVTAYLVHVYHMRNSSTIIKHFSEALAFCLYNQYMAPISYLNTYHARKELKLVKPIQYRITKEKYIIRVTDKSGIFHLGNKSDYKQKAEAYRHKTGVYTMLLLMGGYSIKTDCVINEYTNYWHFQAFRSINSTII